MQNNNNNGMFPGQFSLAVCVGGAEKPTIFIPDIIPSVHSLVIKKSGKLDEKDEIPARDYTIKEIWQMENELLDPLRNRNPSRGSKRKASIITSAITVSIIRHIWHRWDGLSTPIKTDIDWVELIESRVWGNFYPKNETKINIKQLNLEINRRLRNPQMTFGHMALDLIMVKETRI